MSLNRALGGAPPHTPTDLPEDAILWMHAVFCELGLPLRAARGEWKRELGAAALRIEPPSAEHAVPSGRMARLCLMHICDAALRANAVTIDLGESGTPAAERFGVAPKALDLIEQMHRLLAAKVSISLPGAADIPVFDARSRSRGESSEWRSSVRLGSKFVASLGQNAVALDLRIMRQIADSALAVDAYAWIRLRLAQGRADDAPPASWDELLKRFGTSSQSPDAFRAAFETALRLVFDADRSIELAVDDDGVRVRLANGEEQAAPEAAAPQPQPKPETKPEPKPKPAPLTLAPATPPAEAPPAEAPPPPRPAPSPVPPPQPQPHRQPRAPAPAPEPAEPAGEPITQDSICLPRQATGLSHGLWLRRGHGEDRVLIGVTPGMRLEPDRLTVLAVEPMVIQVSGGLYQEDFERVSAWITANRDLIDDFWEGRIATFDEINRRVKKAPAPGWR